MFSTLWNKTVFLTALAGVLIVPVCAMAQSVATSPSGGLQGVSIDSSTSTNSVQHSQYGTYERAMVFKADHQADSKGQVVNQVSSYEVEILSGHWKGQRAMAVSDPKSDDLLNPETGDRLVVFVQPDLNGAPLVFIEQYDRIYVYYWIIALLLFSLLIIAGAKGLKAAANIGLAFFSVLFIALPLYSRSWPGILCFLLAALVYLGLSIPLTLGWQRRTLASFIGTLFGSLLSYGLIYLLASWAKIQGPTNSVDFVFFQNNPALNSVSLVVMGFSFASLAIIQDLAVSISSGISEIKRLKTVMVLKDVFNCGMRIGQEHLTTMLPVLALSAIGLGIFLQFMRLETGESWFYFLNTNAIVQVILMPLAAMMGISISLIIISAVCGIVWTGSFKRNDPLRRALGWRQEELEVDIVEETTIV